MNIAELFVNLGIKGADKTVGALTDVKKKMGELGSTSLEAKAGIVAAMYALEKLFAASGAAGTGLTNFNSLLGVSAKTLQQYQYAARQMGVSNQEVEGTFKTLQSTMTKTLLNGDAPKGLARLSLLTGDLNRGDLLKFQQNPELLIQRLQQYAQKEKNVGLRNETLKSFGVGDGMIAAMSRGGFSSQALAKAPTYSSREIGSLNDANIAWSNLGNKIEMAVGHFNARHGAQLVSDISNIVNQVMKMVEAFTILAEKLKFFQAIGLAFEGWSKILGGITESVGAVTGAVSDPKKRKELFENVKNGIKDFAATASYAVTPESAITPSMIPNNGAVPNQNINVNQNLHFQHDGKDHQKTSQSVKKAVQDSYRQMSAQGQGS